MRHNLSICFAAIIVVCLNAGGQEQNNGRHWVSAWGTAIQMPLQFPGMPPAPVFAEQTLRMVVRPAIGGNRARVRFSNEIGDSPLAIGAAHIAVARHGSAIDPQTDRVLTFGGSPSATIPQGAPLLSDPVDLIIPPHSEIAISLYLPKKTPAKSYHFWAQHETYISGPGDFSGSPELQNPETKLSWFFLSDLEVLAPSQSHATVTLGDSITDGAGVKQGEYSDWPDQLADRLRSAANSTEMAIVNEGIGGNRILYDGAGVSALARFDRDVLAKPGVSNLIVLEGINDIGWPNMKLPAQGTGSVPPPSPFAGQTVTAQDLILGFRQMIERAHQHGIRVLGCTMTPYEGAGYFSAEGETVRQAVNRWIRTSGEFDGIIDFDAAVRDPGHPSQFRAEYQSGDHLHPSAAGYKAMAEAVDLTLLQHGR
jgi:lysophospholipase L1-like esterase